MNRYRSYFIAILLFFSATFAHAIERRIWQVEGVEREALLSPPSTAKEKPAPLVFVFHGHGGTMQHSARSFNVDTLWPEAIVVYMQGLNTPGHITDPEGKKPGWQRTAGDQGDRDLKFFDAVLATLKKELKVDEKRIYSTGHSNGGAFTYLLWAERGDVFAAMAPSAAAAPKQLSSLRPKPALHIAGENDPLVKFAWQQHTINAVLRLNQCDAEGQPWGGQEGAKIYASKSGNPVVVVMHSGGHQAIPSGPALIVKFFKSQALP